MLSLQQVRHLMDDDVLQVVFRLLDQLQVNQNASRIRIARTPLGFHGTHLPLLDSNAHASLPLLYVAGHELLDLSAVPFGHNFMTLFGTGARTNMHINVRF